MGGGSANTSASGLGQPRAAQTPQVGNTSWGGGRGAGSRVALRGAGHDFHTPSGSRTSVAGGVALVSRTGRASHPPAGWGPACIRVWKVEQGTQKSLNFIRTRLSSAAAPTPCREHNQCSRGPREPSAAWLQPFLSPAWGANRSSLPDRRHSALYRPTTGPRVTCLPATPGVHARKEDEVGSGQTEKASSV